MLNNIRNLADHTIVRIFLAFIVVSFVVWGVKDALLGANNHVLVSFSKAKDITESDFAQSKAREIRAIEQNTGQVLSLEHQKELNIDSVVLKHMVTDRMIDYIANFYNLDVSDDFVIDAIKTYDHFKNSEGKFDINIFNANFRNVHGRQEYLAHVRENILKNVVLSIFLESFIPPKSLSDNIITYLSETRAIDLVSMELYASNKNLIILAPSDTELEKFYEKNHKLFTTEEKRSFSYLKISFDSLLSKITVTDDDALEYYNENEDDFKGSKFAAAKKQVALKVKQQKLDQILFELIKNLEEEVASGSTLAEIANKYGGVSSLDGVTYDALAKDKEFAGVENAVFEMSERELSYPIERQEEKQILLVELNNIEKGRLEKFNEVKEKVADLWTQTAIAEANLKNFEMLAKNYKPGDLSLAGLKSNLPVKIENLKIIRADISDKNLPLDLLFLIFERDIADNTPIVRHNDKLYFAHIKSVNIDGAKFKEIENNTKENIITTIRNGVMEEIIDYFIKENDTKSKV
jgi:peptidyl-prolyl cis-trans isomerase D